MKRHEAFIPLSKEHHKILMVAQLLKLDAPKYPNLPNDLLGKIKYAMEVYGNTLKPHMTFEEEQLYPIVLGVHAEVDQQIYMLQDDHTEIDNLFQKIQGEANQAWLMDELGKLIEQHVRQEERELFELLQKHASEDLLKEITDRATAYTHAQ